MCLMATRKRVIPRAPATPDLAASIEEYLQNRSMRERSEYHEGRLKKDLMAILEVVGDRVEQHKQTLELDAPLPYTQYKNGKPVPKKIKGIERRESVSKNLNEDKTLALLERKALTAECTTIIVVVDEDAVLAANYKGKITDQELAALYEKSSRFAFWLTEDTETS